MTHLLATRLLLLMAGFLRIHADPTISTYTHTPCYGDVVTLVCHHPEMATNPGGYLTTGPVWREDRVGIRPSTGIYLKPDTSEDLTHTTLPINVTVDHFRDKSFNYSCGLVLVENGLPTGEVETSGEVTVDPVGPQQPTIKDIDCSINTSIALNWTHTPMKCYKDRISYYVSWVDINNNTEHSNVTGGHMYNITGLVANSNYTISVQAVVDGVNSTADSHNVTTGQPEVVCGDQPACSERNFTLYCKFSPVYEDSYININWMFNSTCINETNMYHISKSQRELDIFNVESTTIGSYGCCIELKNGTFVEGMPYNLHPLGTPKPPQISVQTGISNINVSWEHDRSCFENYTFEFKVTWLEVDTTNTFWRKVNGTTFNIQDLKPGTNYNICVLAVSISDDKVKSDVCQYYWTHPVMPSTKPEDTIAIAVGTVVAVGVVIFIIPVLLLIARVVLGQRKCRAHCCSRKPKSVSYAVSVKMGNDQDIKDQQQTDSQRATNEYVQLNHSCDHPVKIFRDDVKAVLDKNGVICKDLEETNEKKGSTRENAFTAEYNGIELLAICVYTSSDVTHEDASHVVEAKQVTGSTKGLLISNQSTIPSECLLTLEDAGCEFVPVGGYGEEGWEDRMIDKFKNVFPKVANDDSECV